MNNKMVNPDANVASGGGQVLLSAPKGKKMQRRPEERAPNKKIIATSGFKQKGKGLYKVPSYEGKRVKNRQLRLAKYRQ